jgi:lysyl-tRNA synthetase class 1
MAATRPESDSRLTHWADQVAARVIGATPDADVYVVAAGITPSGVVHIGNFREVITVDLVARALRDRGVKVRFIYSWDDFDVFRKVPADAPGRAELEGQLRRSIADVPDPFGEADSYASHYIEQFERSLEPLGIRPEFIRQARRYRAGDYAAGIRRALEASDELRAIIDQHRSAPLPADWLPIAGFCDSCGHDNLALSWPGEWDVRYHCHSCGHDGEVDLRQGGNVKLLWRVDWPMRWVEEGVLFEPGGKDHSTAGGSYDTGREIVERVFGGRAPQYVAYDFVRIKGQGGKISSSSGGAISVTDCLEVYEPEMLRWLFASYRPGTEFQISFDLDVIKLYEDFDRDRRLAREPDGGGRADKKRQAARRLLELASVEPRRIEPGEALPFVPGFRGLTVILQVYDGDLEAALAHYERSGELGTDEERGAFRTRAACAWSWIEQYAPDDFRYRIRHDPVRRVLDDDQRAVLARLVSALREQPGIDEDGLIAELKTLFEGTALTPQAFFPLAYDLLLDRPKGPKLSTLIATMGVDRALPLLAASLEAAP